jgi:hypothetical protein
VNQQQGMTARNVPAVYRQQPTSGCC